MNQKTVTVPNISCGHCTHSIEQEVGELAGVSAVSADVATKQVVIKWDDPADWQTITDTLTEIGFPAQS